MDDMQTQSNETIETLKSKVKGQIVLPDDPNYNEVREIWNAMIDRKPAVIVQCAEADDVLHALSYARENGLEISIRGGGHNIAGSALCNNGVLIDFSHMKAIRVDAQKRRAYVEPGATLGDFDKAVQAHGLATPVGINSITGIAGLTLGGGLGWLNRKYGMTVDNLVSAEMITARKMKIRIYSGRFEAVAVISAWSPGSSSSSIPWGLRYWRDCLFFLSTRQNKYSKSIVNL